MYQFDRLDAHLLARQNVDRRPLRYSRSPSPTCIPSSTATSLEQHRHGLHEPQPVGPRRSRIRFIMTPACGLSRKVITGHWQDTDVRPRLDAWTAPPPAGTTGKTPNSSASATTCGSAAVTEGDKVEAEIAFGFSVNTHGVGDLVQAINAHLRRRHRPPRKRIRRAIHRCTPPSQGRPRLQSLRDAARIELGLRCFLEQGNLMAFTDTFEDLHGMTQLPGIAAQRLMGSGYGFAGEGDWKTAALVRAMKTMGSGLPGGSLLHGRLHLSDFEPGFNRQCLGAHMLEVCRSYRRVAKPSLRDPPLGIGRQSRPGAIGIHRAVWPRRECIDRSDGNRFPHDRQPDRCGATGRTAASPSLGAVWVPRPDLQTAAAAWIYAGGAHHTGFSQALTVEHLQDFADIARFRIPVHR